MSNRSHPAVSVPVSLRLTTNHAHWYICPDGRFCLAGGHGLTRIGMSPDDFLGRHFAEVYGERDDIMVLFRETLLRGTPWQGTVDWGGVLWLVDATPVVTEGALLGVVCVSWVLEPDRRGEERVPAEAPPPSVPVEPAKPRRITEAAGDCGRYGVEAGDRFIKVEGRRGVMQVRHVADSVYEEYVRVDPERVHLISDFPAAVPHLRVVR